MSMKRIVCLGEILLRLGAPGHEPLLRSPRLETSIGGAEANVAIALANLGLDTALVSTLPANALGDACLGELRRHGVDTSSIARSPGRLGLDFLTHGAMRARQVIYDRAGSAFRDGRPLPLRLARGCSLRARGCTSPHHARASVRTASRPSKPHCEPLSPRASGSRSTATFRPSLWRGRERRVAACSRQPHVRPIFGSRAPRMRSSCSGGYEAAAGPASRISAMAGRSFAECPRLAGWPAPIALSTARAATSSVGSG